jgi:tyrosyl-tRNA synthetase
MDISKPKTLVDILVDSKIAPSKSEAIRLITGGGVYINNEKKLDVNEIIDINNFENKEFVLQKGKKQFIKIKNGAIALENAENSIS